MIVSHPKLRPTLMSISHNAQRGDRALPNAPFPTHRRLFTHSNAHCRPTATGLCGRRIAPDTNPNALPPHSAITHGVSLAFSGSLINENSSVTPEHLHLTANGKRGDSGCIQHLVSVSVFSTADTNELRKPRLPISANRCAPFEETATCKENLTEND